MLVGAAGLPAAPVARVLSPARLTAPVVATEETLAYIDGVLRELSHESAHAAKESLGCRGLDRTVGRRPRR